MSRLRRIRELRGADPHRLAEDLQISSAWYFDLEADAPDWSEEISIGKLRQLSRVLDVSPSSLLRHGEEVTPTAHAFVERLEGYLKRRKISAAEFSQEIGWDVERLVADPRQVATLNAAGFRAICEAINLDWVATLDEMQLNK